MEELLGFFDILMNVRGSKTNEAVLEDPETVEQMAAQKEPARRKTPLFGYTEIHDLLQTLIEVQAGQEIFPRPKIPGQELRLKRHISKTLSSVEKAQERSRKRREREQAKLIQSSKGT